MQPFPCGSSVIYGHLSEHNFMHTRKCTFWEPCCCMLAADAKVSVCIAVSLSASPAMRLSRVSPCQNQHQLPENNAS